MRQWFLYILFVTSSAAFAGAQQTHNTLTLDQAIINVLEHSPFIKASDYEAKAAAARIRAAQLSPSYRTSIELENFAGDNGSDNLETTLSLSKVFELGDKAKLRGELSRNKAMLLRNEQDSKRLDLLAETTKYFIDVIAVQERLAITKDSLTLVQRTKSVVEKRVSAGKSPNAELQRAEIALARKQLEFKRAKHDLATSRLKLATQWGETKTLFTSAEADLFDIEQVSSFGAVADLLEHNPDLVRFATEKRLATTRLQLARSGRRADIELSAGVRHFNAADDNALVFSLSMPLGASSRASSSVEEAEMLNLRDPHVYQQRRLILYATLFEVHQEIKRTTNEVATLREIIIPQAERVLKDYEKGYAAGRYSFLELTDAQRALLDSRLEVVMTAANYHRYRIEMDRLTGAGLSTGVNP